MRLFVALSIPAGVGETLAALIDQLRAADAAPKWIKPANLHVTLKFIGGSPPEKLSQIAGALAQIGAAHRVSLEFRDLGFFPHARRPDVLWIGIQATPALFSLSSEVNRVLEPFGIEREEKTFVPHLTIARFKETRLSPALRSEIEKCKGQVFGTLTTGQFHLLESKRSSTGSEYTTLRSFRFAPQEAKGERP